MKQQPKKNKEYEETEIQIEAIVPIYTTIKVIWNIIRIRSEIIITT